MIKYFECSRERFETIFLQVIDATTDKRKKIEWKLGIFTKTV